MSDHTGICIVWPVYSAGSLNAEEHVTAVFLGSTESVEFTKEQVLEALEATKRGYRGGYKVKGTALFGKNRDVPILLLDDADKWLMQDQLMIRSRLLQKGIWYGDSFPFTPHVSLKGEGPHNIPTSVHLEAPVLWWGMERPIHSQHAKREAAVDAAIASVRAEHGDWYGGMAAAYRHVVASAVRGALEVAA